MKILHVSTECHPFAKVGGLGDVVASLPGEIKRLRNADVRVFLPKYRDVEKNYGNKLEQIAEFSIALGDKKPIYVGVESLKHGNIRYYFIDNIFSFSSREHLYGYGDDAERFSYFQKAVLAALPHIPFDPDIIHVHDWHTAMIPLLLKTTYKHLDAKSVLTIHNLAYQGVFPLHDHRFFNMPYDARFEYQGFLNFLKAGICSADLITTVSETYAREIMSEYYGYGLQALLRRRKDDLKGILNGISYKTFNPEHDKLLFTAYDADTFAQGKTKNRAAFFKELDLDAETDHPMIGFVSRLAEQKGIDLIKRVFDELMGFEDFTFVMLGTGSSEYEDYFLRLQKDHPDRVRALITYDERLAHLIYAASDMFLMPSKFEPCGLSQMIALKYGSVPVVRETGGLVDTVTPYNEYENTGNGFSFTNYNAHDMMHVIRYALKVYRHNKTAWEGLVRRGMACDYSWKESAKAYKKAYQQLLRKDE
jgi:starch synthase